MGDNEWYRHLMDLRRHEDLLIHQRLAGLFAGVAFLVIAYSAADSTETAVRVAVSSIGLALTVLVAQTLHEGRRTLDFWNHEPIELEERLYQEGSGPITRRMDWRERQRPEEPPYRLLHRFWVYGFADWLNPRTGIDYFRPQSVWSTAFRYLS